MPSTAYARAQAFGDQRVELQLADPAHRRREGPDARQDDAVGARTASGSLVITASAPTRSSAFSTERRLPIP